MKINFLPSRLTFSLLVLLAVLLMINTGCEKDPGEQKTKGKYYATATGVFVVNEGQFMAGNGDVSFYDKVSRSVANNLFFTMNQRPPGDVLQSITFTNDHAYLIVNNSNTIEVVDLDSFKVISTINSFEMPRQMKVTGNTGYVSQIGSGNIAVVDLTTRKVTGFLPGEKSTDHLLISGNRLFAANWTSWFIDKPNNTVMVYDLGTAMLIDSVEVVKEPNSMVKDADGMIWVLSSGGYMGEEYPALTCFSPTTLQVIKTLTFPDRTSSPSFLTISPDGRTLYFVNRDVFRMEISDPTVPATAFIPHDNRSIYGLAADPVNGEIYLTDARDYQSPGKVFRYTPQGVLLDELAVGINPSGVFFYNR
jgi:DNA-binding beta-propeller fold protein YncE